MKIPPFLLQEVQDCRDTCWLRKKRNDSALTSWVHLREATRWDTLAGITSSGLLRRSPCTWTWSWARTTFRAPSRRHPLARSHLWLSCPSCYRFVALYLDNIPVYFILNSQLNRLLRHITQDLTAFTERVTRLVERPFWLSYMEVSQSLDSPLADDFSIDYESIFSNFVLIDPNMQTIWSERDIFRKNQ